MHHILSARGMLKAPPNPNVALSGNVCPGVTAFKCYIQVAIMGKL